MEPSGLEPGSEMLCPCCDTIAVFESEESPQESLLRSAAAVDGRVLEDPAFPISSVFDVVGREYTSAIRPGEWSTGEQILEQVAGGSESVERESVADSAETSGAATTLEALLSTPGSYASVRPLEPAGTPAESGGGLFHEAGPQRRKEADPAFVNGLLLKARNLHARCQFQDAAELLRSMSEGRKSSEVTSISVQSLYLANLQAAAREAFARVQRGEDELSQCPELSRYSDALKSYGLTDTDMEDRIWRLQRSRTRVKTQDGSSSKIVAVILLLGLLVGILSLLRVGAQGSALLQQKSKDQSQSAEAESKGAETAQQRQSQKRREALLEAAGAGRYRQAAGMLRGISAEEQDRLADDMDRNYRKHVQQLMASGAAEGRAESIRHLEGIQGVLESADPGGVNLKIRRVRCESLQMMANLMASSGNYSGAFDALTAAAQLTPDLPSQGELVSGIAETMVSEMEAGKGGLTAEIVIPELEAAPGIGMPVEIQAKLKQRAGAEMLKRALAAARSGDAGQLQLSVEGYQSMGKGGFTDFARLAGAEQFSGELLDQFDVALAAGDVDGAWLRLQAAVDMGADPRRLAEAQAKMSAWLERDVLSAVSRGDSAATALGCERLRSLHGGLPFSLEQSLCRLSREQLKSLPADLLASLLQVENSVGMSTALLTPGRLQMGVEPAPQNERVKSWSALPVHGVELSGVCWMGATEVTVGQYQTVMQSRLRGQEDHAMDQPCISASWHMATEFCRQLSALPDELSAGRRYRLPTESEWEYGCRAGATTDYCFGDDRKLLTEYAWLCYNSGMQSIELSLTFSGDYDALQQQTARSRTRVHPVGQCRPNAWGLYDMHGNVAEWTADWYGPYSAESQRNPAGPAEGTEKVVRGGNWNSDSLSVRSGHRQALHPEFGRAGFRIVMERFAVQ